MDPFVPAAIPESLKGSEIRPILPPPPIDEFVDKTIKQIDEAEVMKRLGETSETESAWAQLMIQKGYLEWRGANVEFRRASRAFERESQAWRSSKPPWHPSPQHLITFKLFPPLSV